MRSPPSAAMGRPAGAGWPSSESAAATPGVDRATTPYREDPTEVNDSKNLILAIALSALVLLGWTFVANRYFPTANPPSTKIEAGKQQPVPQSSAQPSAPSTPKALQTVAATLAFSPRVSIRTPLLLGSITLK